MPVLMGDDDGSWRRGSTEEGQLEGQLEDMRFDRDCARATIAEQNKRILALEEQFAEARKALDALVKADRIFSPSIQKSPDDVKETGTAAPFTPARTTMGRHDRLATSVAKKLMKMQKDGVLDSPDTRMKRPGFTPGPLPKPSPDDPKPPKKSEKKKGKGFPWI